MSEDCARACGGSLCVYRLSDNAMLVVRAIILVAALVSFSVMSSIEDASSYSEFNFLVFTGVVVFIYSIVQILYGIAVQLSPSVPVRTRLIKVVEVIVESGARAAARGSRLPPNPAPPTPRPPPCHSVSPISLEQSSASLPFPPVWPRPTASTP